MSNGGVEKFQYANKIATVVGGRGALGSRVAKTFQTMGFQEVRICEQGDPFLDFVRTSAVLFFAVNDREIESMLQASQSILKPSHTILDGSSVKKPLVPLYKELDERKVSICSTHLGATPTQPWRGVKVWLCEVGPNSQRAKKVGVDLFLTKNSSIRVITLAEHENVEKDQWFTMALMHIFANALQSRDFSLDEFNTFATLNAELLTLPFARTLGQGTRVPGEILFNQPEKGKFIEAIEASVDLLKQVLGNREALDRFMKDNIAYHDNPVGTVDNLYRKGGLSGARNSNLRMYGASIRIKDDKSGRLKQILDVFEKEGINLTAIDSMPGVITDEEKVQGINEDKIVDFDLGFDPETITSEKVERVMKKLEKMGCEIFSRPAL
jgi:prephenate dehydrogenase